MIVKSGSVWNGLFVTVDATGALATPSAGPTGKLYVDGVANSATVTITGSNPYKFSVSLPSLTAGQHVDMYITATISSIATAGVVASAQADTVLTSDVKTETAAILEDTGTTLDALIKDVPTVSEFEARTKPAADYFDPATDTVANVTAVGTTTNLTNLPTMPADWITASGLKADAVAEIQAGLALEATLQAIRGASGDTLETLSNEIAAKMATAENIEGTYTLKDAIRIILAFAAGKVSGGGTSSIKFRSTGDDVDRIQATVDSSGNRTAVTLNPNDTV